MWGPIADFMSTETVVMEGRVLRFEKANRNFNSGSEFDANYNSSEPPSTPKEFRVDTPYYPQAHPQSYVPFYSYGNNLQPAHNFQIPNQSILVYPSHSYRFHQITVRVPIPAPISSSISEPSVSVEEVNKVFVGQCQLNGELVTQRKLLRHFQHHGHITDIELFKNNLDGSLRPEAFAFISFLKPEQVLQAIQEKNGSEWLGRRLKCCKAHKKPESVANPAAAAVDLSR